MGAELSPPEDRARERDARRLRPHPACGYEPKTLDEIYGKVLAGKAVIVDGEMEILPA
jgi:hypothetical protein